MFTAKDIGIIGAGFVGGAIKHYYKEAKIWDKYKDAGNTREEVLAQPVIFLCLPTPYAIKARSVFRGADISAIEENLATLPRGRIAVLKSTIPPGTTKYLQGKFPEIHILFNPEFLTAAVAKEDFASPDKQILGYASRKAKNFAQELMGLLPKPAGGHALILPAIEAELVKYMINTYYASKVIFANQMYDVCKIVGARYEMVRQGFAYDKRVDDSHFDVWHGGYRGYSGPCLPKDTKTFVRFAREQGIDLKFHRIVDKINEELLKSGPKGSPSDGKKIKP
ncbi:MAG: UDP-glucose/GDP-mannose dehydrogenase family protein [Candidatus Spechtbacteria bacterium]|nr:UDP-glucose/GDP-mannose dehydrogenase family protein [Candidatus Spechtbacteria bacterium]